MPAIILIGTVILDLVTKYLAISNGARVTFNHGALGGYLSLGYALPIILGLAFIVFLYLQSARANKANRPEIAAGLALAAGGGSANILEFAYFKSVTDFVWVDLGTFGGVAMNVADMALISGAIMVFWFGMWPGRGGEKHDLAC